ncbi:GNAT family N-acetyltransferase [Pedobacter mendelii]|uniref:N-acetyltransferase n=1 Tax=Pedobacter mendelii TaxID=1908240 RepID=A0ABQ2BIV0_9SPHI|nr:GNAT family N-acetyltransferase [Pedobacter mendelii]GGI25252.1 N-acetyltransferase [Pedobacter mendelii]
MIRKAKISDAKAVSRLIIQAMGELAYKFSNTNNHDATIKLFEHFFKEANNQYSFENTLVYTNENDEVLGSINAYDGAKLIELRTNFLNYLSLHCRLKNFIPEPETQAGEFYLDTISVNPTAQGKGIGKQLIDAGIKWAAELGHTKIGLLVETNNDKALKLYQNKGFKINDEKQLIGGIYHHMIYHISV